MKWAGSRWTGLGAVAIAGAVVLSGCSDKKEAKPGPTGSGKPGGATRSSAAYEKRSVPLPVKDGVARLDLTALSRTSGSTVTARFTVANDGKTPLTVSGALGDQLNDPGAGYILSLGGLGMVDVQGGKVYMPLRNGDHCFCSEDIKTLPPGGSQDLYAIFPAPPANVQRVTITAPTAAPLENVPIVTGPVAPVPGQTADAAAAAGGQQRVANLVVTSTGIDQGVDDSGDDRKVNLQSDVLFALNKADLTPRADALLRQVAQQIDKSRGQTVKVDGHADSSGNDAINQPLSERRAQTVANRLKSLVTRQGVTFQPAGHGSTQPIANNGSEEGRRRNRRVTVTFPKPQDPVTPPAGGGPYQYGSGKVLGSGEIRGAAGLRYEINSLHRTGDGLVVLVWTIKNAGGADSPFLQGFERSFMLYGTGPNNRGFTTGGVMLEDPAAKARYWPVEDSLGHCACYGFVEASKSKLAAGESLTVWGLYRPPAGATSFDVSIPWTDHVAAVAKGIPLS
ncbi:OmpA family protein [Actinomadura logoneensis]|uniref:OmpA family protein n=1 Tax=Actinomadura logoneensis TaxID=2293572 RepID=A0A372JD36_9ACTN|nr:OmpA family protein [Actinomadura logoneensis]